MNDLESVRQLASAMIDGTISSADAERLSAILRDHPESRDAYLDFLDTHAALCWHFRDLASAPTAPAPTPGLRRWRVAAWFPWLVAGLAAAVALVAFLRPGGFPGAAPPEGDPPAQEATKVPPRGDSFVALLVDEAGAKFAPERGPQGVRLVPGEYELTEGIVHLRFAQGADVVLAAPARLKVKDAQHIQLVAGKIRVTAPPTAKGFTVATRDANFVDLGTEFGLRVDPASGASDLYVFDGQVNVADPRSGKILSEVREGKSARYVEGSSMEPPDFQQVDFPTPGVIGFKRWEGYAREMLKTPGLLAFYSFRRGTDEAVLVNEAAEQTVLAGRIEGARWTSGRWPGKEALLFDRDTDFVQLDIPGRYEELTIAAWVHVERLDFELNALLNSDGYDPGDVHFQLTRQGYLRGGLVVVGNFTDRVVGGVVPLGQWTHVTSVLSARTRSQRIYINGTLARERQWRQNETIRPGSCRLGNWLPDAKTSMPNRALRGRIDELAIWNRVLSEREVKQLVEDGRPGLLWNEN